MLFLPGRINWKPACAVWLWNAVGEPYGWILPCRMLGDMGNSCWKEPARDEPCSCSISWRILVEELIQHGMAGNLLDCV